MCLISSLIKSYIPGKCFLCSPAGNMYLVYLVFFVYFVLLENESRKRKTPKQTFAVIEKLGNSGRMGGEILLRFSKCGILSELRTQLTVFSVSEEKLSRKIEAPASADLGLHVCLLFVPSCSITGFLIVLATSHFSPIRPSLQSLSPHSQLLTSISPAFRGIKGAGCSHTLVCPQKATVGPQ